MVSIVDDSFQDNWIVLDLENQDDTNDSFVDIFNPTIDYNGSQQYDLSFTFPASVTNVVIAYGDELGAQSKTFTGTFFSMQEIADALNDFFIDGSGVVFTSKQLTPIKFELIGVSNKFSFGTFNSPETGLLPFTQSSTTKTAGSSISVTSESNIDMNAITQELAFQPYKLENVNIYTNTIEQANNDMTLLQRGINGVEYKRIKYPSINPVQRQFALENIEISYLPDPTNKLTYKIDASQQVRLIFKYIRITDEQMYDTVVESVNGFEQEFVPIQITKSEAPIMIRIVSDQIKTNSNSSIKSLIQGYL